MVLKERNNLPFSLIARSLNQDNIDYFKLADKLVNLTMYSGKKQKAFKIVTKALSIVKSSLRSSVNNRRDANKITSGVEGLRQAVLNVQPYIELRKVRVHRTVHQVPSSITETRQQGIALRWIIEAARSLRKSARGKLDFSSALARVIIDGINKEGPVRQKRDSLHKAAEANRSSAHLRWW